MTTSLSVCSKLPHVGTTIFSVMTALAIEYQAINLAQGFPDFPCDPVLVDGVTKAMKDGHNQYAPMAGLLRLREIIATYIYDLYKAEYHPDSEITITSGATEALYAAITALVGKGDEVIIFEPCYDAYLPAIELNGGVPVTIELEPPDYTIDWKKVRAMMNDRTKLMILNSPNNPTASTITQEDILNLKDLIEHFPFFILSDEVYEHLVYDGRTHISMCADDILKARSLIVASFGKSLHVTGWKVGYCLAPKHLTAEFRKVHQFLTFCTHLPTQVAIADYLQNDALTKFADLRKMYQTKRDYFQRLMQQTRFKPLDSTGTYFQLYSFSDITNENDTDFAVRLTKEYGVATVPVSAFYASGRDEGLLRFCFAKKEETLNQAVERLCKI
jgi:methionine aminotransferase